MATNLAFNPTLEDRIIVASGELTVKPPVKSLSTQTPPHPEQKQMAELLAHCIGIAVTITKLSVHDDSTQSTV
ncbi:MAG: hypothetical protein HC765_14580 [Brachymonas sp.]|nr:hypothetical protein [Brachymonas sp.]